MKPFHPIRRGKTKKTRHASDRYWIEARDQGEDLHILIGRRDGSGAKAHFIVDGQTAEIRVESQRSIPEELIRSIESTLALRDGTTVHFRREAASPEWTTVARLPSDSDPLLDSVTSFGASVLHTGGVGSRVVTPTAWLLDEHGYLPASQLVQYSFSSAGDLLIVYPPAGFLIEEPYSPTGNSVMGNDDGSWTGMFLRDALKNELHYVCRREPAATASEASHGA